MSNIREFFVNEVISKFNDIEYNMPYIPFIFDDETINELYTYLKEDNQTGREYLTYLKTIKNKQEKDNTYIPVHDSNKFFSLLQEFVNLNSKYYKSAITYLWLRMGVDDTQNVEKFIQRQISFLKNHSVLGSYKEILSLKEHRVLAYRVDSNKPYFEADRHITFSIRDSSKNILDLPKDYEFPGIYFGLTKENNRPTCYIYSIQNTNSIKDGKIKEDIQPIRKELRNKYVSADFLIGLSLFLDFLYDNNIVDIVVPTLQVFNHSYHKQLSDSISSFFDSYSEDYKKELEELYTKGDRSDKVLDYIYTKNQVDRFVNKEDIISHNKTERLINMFFELKQRFNSFDIICEPFIQGENLIIHLHGKTDILEKIIETKKIKK